MQLPVGHPVKAQPKRKQHKQRKHAYTVQKPTYPSRETPHTTFDFPTIEEATTSMTTTGGPDPAVMEAIERGNAVVFFDVVLGAEGENAAPLGRIKLELFVKDVSLKQ